MTPNDEFDAKHWIIFLAILCGIALAVIAVREVMKLS